MCLWIATLVGAEVIYVDESALGLSSGDSWDEAYRSLQDALDRIGRTDAPVEGMEIWVAEGVYYPDEGNGRDNDDREATFRLYNGTTIYGGFGGEETTIEARDPSKYVTVLSGDITQSNWEENGNVVGEDPEEGLNSYHVVTAQNIDESAVLDGVTITGGVADGIGHLEGGKTFRLFEMKWMTIPN